MRNERGMGRRHRRGPGPGRMRRGEVRTAVLAVLAERPGHGYDIIQSLEEKSGGAWRPSPGSIYPTLQQLEDEDLVRSSEREGKRTEDRSQKEPLEGTVSAPAHHDGKREPDAEPSREDDQENRGRRAGEPQHGLEPIRFGHPRAPHAS